MLCTVYAYVRSVVVSSTLLYIEHKLMENHSPFDNMSIRYCGKEERKKIMVID